MKNTAYKAWETRYENEMNILKREMDELREEFHAKPWGYPWVVTFIYPWGDI